MAKLPRTRLQLELGSHHRRLLHVLSEQLGTGGDAETTRRVLDIVENLVDRIRQGFKLAAVPMADEHPDALPELTRALRPEMHYTYLVARPHSWRRQLSFKGRRLTVGQFLVACGQRNGRRNRPRRSSIFRSTQRTRRSNTANAMRP